ncbi:TlpA family protein disulfide reductase [Longibacter salinarum]|nr:TlpA disulfide reductase family protein [Longibacter salinarum]
MWGILLVFGFYLWNDLSPDIDLPDRGPRAPDFALTQMNGETFQLSRHRGEVVVLNVWATWCPPCRVEIPGFVELQDQFAEDGVQFVGLSVDEQGLDAVREFGRTNELNYPQVASRSVAWKKYGQTRTVPRTYVIDKAGRVRYRHTGLLLKGALEPVLNELSAEEYSASEMSALEADEMTTR